MKKLLKSDIIKSGKVNHKNLDELCKRINEAAAWDKTGSQFYKIDNRKGSYINRDIDFVSEWLDFLVTLRETSEVIEYKGEK